MKIAISSSQFKEKMGLVSRVISSRPTAPVLSNVRLFVEDQKATICATDLNATIEVDLYNVDFYQDGVITFNAKLMNDFLSKLPEQHIVIEHQYPGNYNPNEDASPDLKVTTEKGNYSFKTLNADIFPDVEMNIKGMNIISIPTQDLLTGISNSLYAVATDETKQVLTGIFLQLSRDTIDFAATDGHRLSTSQFPLQKEQYASVVIPAKTAAEVKRILLNYKEEEIVFSFNETHIHFNFTNINFYGRVLSGQYPNLHQLFPQQFNNEVTVNRKSLISSIERISLFCAKTSDIFIELDSKKQILLIYVENNDANLGSGKEDLPALVSGDIVFRFNSKYLLDALKVINSEELFIKGNEFNQPVICSPIGERAKHLIMPLARIK